MGSLFRVVTNDSGFTRDVNVVWLLKYIAPHTQNSTGNINSRNNFCLFFIVIMSFYESVIFKYWLYRLF